MHDSRAQSENLEKLINIEPKEWFEGMVRGIVTQFSDSKTPTIAKVIAAEHLYALVNRNFVLPFSFAKTFHFLFTDTQQTPDWSQWENALWHEFMAWQHGLDLLPFPNGDPVAFDNDQVVQKHWTVWVDNKANVSILTSIFHAEVDPNGSLQRKADLFPRYHLAPQL